MHVPGGQSATFAKGNCHASSPECALTFMSCRSPMSDSRASWTAWGLESLLIPMSSENSTKACRTCSEHSTGYTWHPGTRFACAWRIPRRNSFELANLRLLRFARIEHGYCGTKRLRDALFPVLDRRVS